MLLSGQFRLQTPSMSDPVYCCFWYYCDFGPFKRLWGADPKGSQRKRKAKQDGSKKMCVCWETGGVAYASGTRPRGVLEGPRSRCFSSMDGSVLPPCRWMSGLVCKSTQLLARAPRSSGFLQLKMLILWAGSGLPSPEPAGLGCLRLTGSTARPFWARQASSEREDSSSCTTALASLQGLGPEREAGQQAPLQSVMEEAAARLPRPRGRAVRPARCDVPAGPSLMALPTRSRVSPVADWTVLVGRWMSMAAVVMTWATAAEAPGRHWNFLPKVKPGTQDVALKDI